MGEDLRLTKRGKVAAGLAGIAVTGALGVGVIEAAPVAANIVTAPIDEYKEYKADQERQETFSEEGLVDKYTGFLAPEKPLEEPAVVIQATEPGAGADSIAHSIGGGSDVAAMITNQAGEHVDLGEKFLVPRDAVDEDSYTVVRDLSEHNAAANAEYPEEFIVEVAPKDPSAPAG
jgi:hypothetical protein